jgi:hypothetical protein
LRAGRKRKKNRAACDPASFRSWNEATFPGGTNREALHLFSILFQNIINLPLNHNLNLIFSNARLFVPGFHPQPNTGDQGFKFLGFEPQEES